MDAKQEFLTKLWTLIQETENGPIFKGRTQTVKMLRRVANLSILTKAA